MYISRNILAVVLMSGTLSAAVDASQTYDALPTTLRQALSRRENPSGDSYRMTIRTDRFTAVVQVDPGRPTGQRATVVTPAAAPGSKELSGIVSELDKSADRALWCDRRAADLLPREVTMASESQADVTYSFQPQPGEGASPEDAKLLRNLVATVTVSKGDSTVLGIALKSPKPFRPSLLARVESFEASITCRPVRV